MPVNYEGAGPATGRAVGTPCATRELLGRTVVELGSSVRAFGKRGLLCPNLVVAASR